jgi:L-ascorbate metabolism protein UlaG (beta-lactamase superfamily)
MKITKYEHAALVVELNGDKVIVDPGSYTKTMPEQHNVKAIVITHIHDDHCSEPQLDKIVALNPGIKIYGTDEVCRRLTESRPNFETVAVHHGDHYKEGDFTIEFYGDMHLEIHSSWPMCQNVGVMINNTLYYPGDSYTIPDVKVPMLAVPSSAPWAKLSMIIDFVNAVKPSHAFATHNIHLSAEGHQMYNGRIKMITESHGGSFTHLEPGDSISA